MIQMLATLLIGFSLFSALLLLITHFRCSEYKGKLLPRLAGIALLASLAGLQVVHYFFINLGLERTEWLFSTLLPIFYNLCLFTVAPALYFFSKNLLKVSNSPTLFSTPSLQWLHLAPLLVAPLMPYTIAQPLSFFIGSFYVIWLAYTLYQLRDQRSRFRQEIGALIVMFLIAITVLILGLFIPVIGKDIFYAYYAINIGLAFFVTSAILLTSPSITSEVSEAAQASYVASTLEHINSDKALEKIESLMQEDKLYRNEHLQLSNLAEAVDLSPHQLSELINTRLGKGFSHYLREYRIAEAKRLLVEQPKASVLSIGLEVGFTSQSNFYAAFKQIEAMAPGQFRKRQL